MDAIGTSVMDTEEQEVGGTNRETDQREEEEKVARV
jgi:hypothetical protein